MIILFPGFGLSVGNFRKNKKDSNQDGFLLWGNITVYYGYIDSIEPSAGLIFERFESKRDIGHWYIF